MKGFFRTVALVTVFSISEKFLGFIYRIYMSHTIGSEGVGLYQVALSTFAFLFTLISSGIPITVSRLMTKYKALNDQKRVNKIMTAGIILSLVFSIPVCLITLIFRNKLDFLFADQRCLDIFLVLMPGLIFTSVYSVMRGIFWGNKDFFPYSVIELLEEICMIVFGILLINRAVTVYQGAFRAGVAVLISYIFSFSLSIVVFIYRKNKLSNPVSQFKPLLKSSTPVTVMRTVGTLSTSLVSFILPARLIECGYSSAKALSLFGSAVGQAIPLMFIPTSLISSFILVLVPQISEHYYKKEHLSLKNDVEKSVNFTLFLSCAFFPIFLVCGKELGVIVFNSHECGDFLTVASFLVVFIGLTNITTSILNSLGSENSVLLFYMISGVFMILCAWFLPKYLGIYSLVIGYLFIYGLTGILNLRLIYKKSVKKPKVLSAILYSLAFTIPTSIIGFMVEKIAIGILGSFFTVLLTSTLMCAFMLALYIGFNLIDLKDLKIFSRKRKKAKKNFA